VCTAAGCLSAEHRDPRDALYRGGTVETVITLSLFLGEHLRVVRIMLLAGIVTPSIIIIAIGIKKSETRAEINRFDFQTIFPQRLIVTLHVVGVHGYR